MYSCGSRVVAIGRMLLVYSDLRRTRADHGLAPIGRVLLIYSDLQCTCADHQVSQYDVFSWFTMYLTRCRTLAVAIGRVLLIYSALVQLSLIHI